MKTNKPISLRVLQTKASARPVRWWMIVIALVVLIAIAAQLAGSQPN